MFLKDATFKSGSDRNDQAWAKGNFLVLMHEEKIEERGLVALGTPVRALVRPAKLRQFGHFMMGTMRVGHYEIGLSGSYGGDGLTINVPPAVYRHGLEVPADLMERWNTGGGHNSAGSEAEPFRMWAAQHLGELTTDKDMKYDRATLNQVPDLDNPDSHDRLLVVRNVDSDGVSYTTLRSDWIIEAFREGRAAYHFTFGERVCEETMPKPKKVGNENVLIDASWRELWWDIVQPKLKQHGWTAYERGPHTMKFYAPVGEWTKRLRYQAGFSN